MRTIIIILSALGAAILVLSFLKSWQRHRSSQRGEIPSESVSFIHLISALVGLSVFFIGALWLESNSAPPGSIYAPAKILDGTVKSGEFDRQTNQ